MNKAVRDYVQSVIERERELVRGASVIEIGSYNVNGTVRDLFEAAGCGKYKGLDIRPGPGVDEVLEDRYEIAVDMPDTGHVVVCCEVAEHDPNPHRLFEALGDRLRYGGILIATARGNGYGLHDEPEDYWRFTKHGWRALLQWALGANPIEVIDHRESMGVFGYGKA